MCKVIYLGSVEPLPECDALELRPVPYPGQPAADYADLQAAMPQARHLYSLGGCQCYFRYHPESQADNEDLPPVEDKVMADTMNAHLRACNAYVARTADYLEAHLARTRIWLVWKWEGVPVTPDCECWTRTPAYFRQQDFTMPSTEGVITLVSDDLASGAAEVGERGVSPLFVTSNRGLTPPARPKTHGSSRSPQTLSGTTNGLR
jgi:hypothetical protein